MKVQRNKENKVVVSLPHRHGMGKAMAFLDERNIQYRWKNAGNLYGNDYSEKQIEYHFDNESDALLFVLWKE